jgi:methionyl-tRNA formyltransferase
VVTGLKTGLSPMQCLPGAADNPFSSELESASKIDLEARYRARDLLKLLRASTFDGHPGCWFEESGNRYEVSIHIIKVN